MIVAERLSGLRQARRLRPGDVFRWTSGNRDLVNLVISSCLIDDQWNLDEEVTYVTCRDLKRQVTKAIVPYTAATVIMDG